MRLFHKQFVDYKDCKKIEEKHPWVGRAILLVDLDAFFASVEQLDHEEWRGRPVIVGGPPDKRGVVSTASYEARAHGVHSAMPSSVAQRLCPQACWSYGNYARYSEMSNVVMEILFHETPHVQQVSIDEAFLDITPNRINKEHPASIAWRIQEHVSQLGITCSIGLGSTKTVAKLASNIDKPQGLTIIMHGEEEAFFNMLAIRKLNGVGPALEKNLVGAGITTIGELYRTPIETIQQLGTGVEHLYERLHGYDTPVESKRPKAKSISHEESFPVDLSSRKDCIEALMQIGEKLGRRLRKGNHRGDSIFIKVKFSNYKLKTKQTTLSAPTQYEYEFIPEVIQLFDELWKPGDKVRLLGIGIGGFEQDQEQMSIFPPFENENIEMNGEEEKTKRSLVDVSDSIKDKFGESAIKKGLFRDLYHH